ncbi:Transcription elongation factor A protein 3 [Fukomys damarensis]|uniref:Transcription elongation factor A protein 3 n=1 Tax=Fukomys damarensis TaxID=885580 RepID=A0A091E2H8_FUKDA|nr:Transcription elongation factor A protein 3 [Fukomys damarensis]
MSQASQHVVERPGTKEDSVQDKCVETSVDDDYKDYGVTSDKMASESNVNYQDLKSRDMRYQDHMCSYISNLKDPSIPGIRWHWLSRAISTRLSGKMTVEKMAQEAICEYQMGQDLLE